MSAEKKIKILNIAFSSTYISHYTEHAIFLSWCVKYYQGLFHIYFVYHITIFFVSQDTCIMIETHTQHQLVNYHTLFSTCCIYMYTLALWIVLACLVQQYLLVRTLYLGHNWGFTKILYYICCSSGYHFTDVYQMFFQLSTKKSSDVFTIQNSIHVHVFILIALQHKIRFK